MSECSCSVGLAIVEDEKELVKVLLKMFEIRKIRVCFVAYDGHDALAEFTKCNPKPHLVLMDYRLPSMDGIKVTTEILKIAPDTKVIFLSADEAIRKEALDTGAIAFLQKPISLEEICRHIQEVVDDYPGIKVYSTQPSG